MISQVNNTLGQNLEDDQFIGRSAAFGCMVETISAVAPRDCSVIITGETGAGKEMVARCIHVNSARANKRFVPVDCTTLTGQLFESQLFGHVKGAFTGATGDSIGFFRAADQSTIFLDEIGEIPLELQAKLLRVLQEGSVTPLGSTKQYSVDVRVICATNRNLYQMVQQGKFRADLYYRLNVITLSVPPLRDRKADILILADHFLSKQAQLYGDRTKTLSGELKKILLEYSWPGNVRELANLMERAHVLSRSDIIDTSVLPEEMLQSMCEPFDPDQNLTLDFVSREAIIRALNRARGRKMTAAKLLQIDHRKLNRLMSRLDIQLAAV